MCDGLSCEHCTDGQFRLTECARFYTADIAKAINMAGMADKHLPSAGGLLDQSAWFLSLWSALTSEQNKIDLERLERR